MGAAVLRPLIEANTEYRAVGRGLELDPEINRVRVVFRYRARGGARDEQTRRRQPAGDIDRGGLGRAVERSIIGYPRDGSLRISSETGWVLAARRVADALEHLLVMRQRIAAGQ